jgi:hypothetical protein
MTMLRTVPPLMLLTVLTACGGLDTKCTSNGDCDAASYCNLAIAACFGRNGQNVPTITSVTVGPASGHITVHGTSPANATVEVFTDDQCVTPPVGTALADSSGAFTVDAVAPSTGRVRATAEVGGVESICSSFKQYP